MTAPSKEWKERIAPDEEARFEKLANVIVGIQASAAEGPTKNRALHAKSHGALTGTFEVLPNLSGEVRQGLFREPRTYPVVIRFSNGSARNLHDKAQDARGIALKVIGVEGEKVIPALADALTQDFLFIQSAAIPFRTPEHFVGAVSAVMGHKLLTLPRLVGALGTELPATLGRLKATRAEAPESMLDTRLHTALPIRFGAYAAKLDLVPAHEAKSAADGSRDQYARDIDARAKVAEHAWTIRAQLFVDEARTPIEDPTVQWPEDLSPFVEIARVSAPAQDPTSDAGRALSERVESLSFDPWHALVDHRPLGAMMRARNVAYRASTQARGAAPEPRSIDEVARGEG